MISDLFRPFAGCVVDAKNDADGVTYAIGDDIGEAGNDQFTCVRNSAGASRSGETGEPTTRNCECHFSCLPFWLSPYGKELQQHCGIAACDPAFIVYAVYTTSSDMRRRARTLG